MLLKLYKRAFGINLVRNVKIETHIWTFGPRCARVYRIINKIVTNGNIYITLLSFDHIKVTYKYLGPEGDFFILLKVWDGLSGEEELSLQHKHIVKSVFFSNDSAALATARYDYSVLSTPPPPPLHAIVSDPDPGSNWIRIRISDPRGQKLPTKIEKR